MAGRCVICEGRIANGRCQDCGMDYSRVAEHRYRLNEDCGTYSPKAGEQKQSYGRTLPGKAEKAADVNGSGQAGQRAGASGSGRTKKQANKYGSGQTGKQAARYGSGQAKKQPGGYGRTAGQKMPKSGGARTRPVSVVKWAVAVWIILGLLSGLLASGLPDWFPGREQVTDWLDGGPDAEWEAASDPEEQFYDENEARTTEDLYDYVEAAMPEDGDEWSAFLTAGIYTVGESIPQGTYRVTVMEGKGSLHVEDWENSIWYYSWLEPENEVDDLRLYPGAQVTVEGGCELEFFGENAQAEALIPYEADESLEDVELSTGGAYLVGTDIAPGRYDVHFAAEGASRIMEVRVEAENGDTQMIFVSDYGPEEGYREVFHNLSLADGDMVVLEGAMEGDAVYLSPELEFP